MNERPNGTADGFLGRWSRRKNDALNGKPLEEPAGSVAPAVSLSEHPWVAGTSPGAVSATTPGAPQGEAETAPSPELSIDDARLLTKDSDFKPFMASSVGPDVRNAAMKKLFADPHFNVMDGLDIYIDDYSISEPIPESMLRRMASAKFLKLFDDDEDDEGDLDGKVQPVAKSVDNGALAELTLRANADAPGAETVAHSDAPPLITHPGPSAFLTTSVHRQPEPLTAPDASQPAHDHTDLRLQPDDAASGPEAGRRT